MKIHELLEARKNPEMNPKISINDEMKRYAAEHPGNCYISFTAIEKLGVNPRSMFGTPIGVYCYPLEYAIAKMGDDSSASVLPYAGGEKFANLFTVSGNVVDLDTITEADMQSHISALARILPSDIADGLDDFVDEAEDEATVSTPAGRLWYIVRKCAMLLVEHRNKSGQSLTTLFAWLFRKLGFDGLIDRSGRGIIHGNEKTQGVIFTSSVIENVKRVQNSYAPSAIATSKFHGQRKIVAKQKVKEILASKATISNKLQEAIKSNVLRLLPQTFFDTIEPSDVRATFPNSRDTAAAMSLFLTKNFNRFLPQCENFIKMDDLLSFTYSVYATRSRFIAGEPAIKDTPSVWAQYVQKFPEAK